MLGRDAVGTVVARPSEDREIKVVEISSSNEEGDEVEPPVLSREVAVVGPSAGPSSGPEETDLEWPCPEDPTKVRFVLQDS